MDKPHKSHEWDIQLIQANFTTKILDDFAKPPILIISPNSKSTIQHMLLNGPKSPGPQPQLHRNCVVYPLIGSCLRIFISQKKKIILDIYLVEVNCWGWWCFWKHFDITLCANIKRLLKLNILIEKSGGSFMLWDNTDFADSSSRREGEWRGGKGKNNNWTGCWKERHTFSFRMMEAHLYIFIAFWTVRL